MKDNKRNFYLKLNLLFLALLLTLTLSACNTIVGMGEDVSSVGYAMGAHKNQ